MRIIGIAKDSGYEGPYYIAEVSHEELKKVVNKASYAERDKFAPLKAGSEIDIGAGYDFRRDIAEATRKMVEAHEQFAKSTKVMHRFASMVVAADAGADEEKAS